MFPCSLYLSILCAGDLGFCSLCQPGKFSTSSGLPHELKQVKAWISLGCASVNSRKHGYLVWFYLTQSWQPAEWLGLDGCIFAFNPPVSLVDCPQLACRDGLAKISLHNTQGCFDSCFRSLTCDMIFRSRMPAFIGIWMKMSVCLSVCLQYGLCAGAPTSSACLSCRAGTYWTGSGWLRWTEHRISWPSSQYGSCCNCYWHSLCWKGLLTGANDAIACSLCQPGTYSSDTGGPLFWLIIWGRLNKT